MLDCHLDIDDLKLVTFLDVGDTISMLIVTKILKLSHKFCDEISVSNIRQQHRFNFCFAQKNRTKILVLGY